MSRKITEIVLIIKELKLSIVTVESRAPCCSFEFGRNQSKLQTGTNVSSYSSIFRRSRKIAKSDY